ncbi:MAG: carboxypeptidase regulatory-like domain-containing protein [Rubrivivax sp.]|nr:carboxypeptidase regulatory-like domain-containing protein [Rubrivivax sp.]
MTSPITADRLTDRVRRAFAAAGVALLLAACGGKDGGGGSAEPALPPETTAYSIATSTPLSYAVRGAGSNTQRFGLVSAPDGLEIDPRSGQVEWTPRPDQIGEHDVAVTVTDAGGAVTNKTYHITVSAPDGQGAYLVLRTDAVVYTPGQAIVAQWRLGGELPQGAAIELGVQAPEVDPGAPEASPIAWTLGAQGAWSATPVRLQDATRAGQASLVLPNRVPGHWTITARLLDADGAPLASMAARVLVAEVPTLRLVLNRPVANPLDTVRAVVDLAAGDTPVATRLMAWMVQPDGSKLGLPSLDPAELEVHRDATAGGRHVLLEREFSAAESGDYRILVRLYAAADGRLLREAGARFSVCAAASTLSGVVRKPDRGPVDGPAMTQAVVQALDVDDGGVTEAARVAAGGAYTLTLPPGRYLVSVRAIDPSGAALEADGAPVLVGCTPGALARDFQLRTR